MWRNNVVCPHNNLGTLFRQKKVRKGGGVPLWRTKSAKQYLTGSLTGLPCFVGEQIIIWNKKKRNIGPVWLVLFFSTQENKDYLGDANRWYRLTQRPHCHKRTKEYYLCQQMSTDHYTRRPYTKPEPDYLNLRFMLYLIPQCIQPKKSITKNVTMYYK